MNAYSRVTGKPVEERTNPPPTPEERARVKEKVAAFLAEARASKNEAAKEEMTPERADMLRRIMELPDRHAPSVEEMQHRRRMETLITSQEELR